MCSSTARQLSVFFKGVSNISCSSWPMLRVAAGSYCSYFLSSCVGGWSPLWVLIAFSPSLSAELEQSSLAWCHYCHVLRVFGDACLKIFLEQVVGLLHIPLSWIKVFALLWHESELPCSPGMAPFSIFPIAAIWFVFASALCSPFGWACFLLGLNYGSWEIGMVCGSNGMQTCGQPDLS